MSDDRFLSIEDARGRILSSITPLGVERCLLDDAAGRVLAEVVTSPIDWPRFDNSAMDGYALRHEDLGALTGDGTSVRLRVPEIVQAGQTPSRALAPGEAFRIMTGAPVPEGADTVVMRENTREGEGEVEVVTAPSKGRGANIRRRGEDVHEGQQLFEPGAEVDAGIIGMLASFGRSQLRVYRRPRVAIVSTGDELVEVDVAPGPGQIINSSSYMLAAQIREAGGVPVVLPIARDVRDDIEAALDAACAAADIVVTVGGVSMGDADLARDIILERADGMSFWKVVMKPGKPLAFGMVGSTPLIGLPGNPVSSFVAFLQFVRPAIGKASGRTSWLLPRLEARTTRPLRGPRRRVELVRGVARRSESGVLFAPHPRQGSGNLHSVAGVNALGVVSAGAELAEGDALEIELFGALR